MIAFAAAGSGDGGNNSSYPGRNWGLSGITFSGTTNSIASLYTVTNNCWQALYSINIGKITTTTNQTVTATVSDSTCGYNIGIGIQIILIS